MKNLPGSLWKHHGTWNWRVRLPNAEKRKNVVLRMPCSGTPIPESASISLAESAAWRLWESAAAQAKKGTRSAFTTNDLLDKWAIHAQEYYSQKEALGVTSGMRLFRELFGARPLESLTHGDMLTFRDTMVKMGLSRSTVNKRLGIVKRISAWALDELLMSAQTKAELTQISNLKRGRSAAKEVIPVTAAQDGDIEKTLAYMPPSLADMVRVHRLTGMRPGEVCALAWGQIERRHDVWVFRPVDHKNEWRGQPRAIVIGPKAQAILARYEGQAPFIFSPAFAMKERYEELRARRKSKVQPSQIDRSCIDPMRKPGEQWEVGAYAKAVLNACRAAHVKWTPNQLRHTCATEVRRQFGIMAAHAILGHALGPRITDVYSYEAAADEAIRLATPAMLALG